VKALFLNGTLKGSSDPSNTAMLAEEVLAGLRERDVECEAVRLVDLDILRGVSSDEGAGDEWPGVREKILASDIVILGTPTWLARSPASPSALSSAWTRCSPSRTTRGV